MGCQEYTVFTDTREDDVAQNFVVEGVKTDIIFYADTSFSMQRELASLGGEVRNFVSRLDGAQSDWQIIAVTGPDGCGNGGILTPDTPNFADAFAEAIKTPPAEDNVDEWGLFNVFKAILETSPGGCNDGFIRQDASLHVIFISDEDDNSPGWGTEDNRIDGYWQTYVDPILYVKDSPGLVKVSAIIGDVPNGCGDGAADPGWGYAEAVEATGGDQISICSDWEDQVGLLADSSVAQAFFPMDWEPLVVEEIEVEVNDELRESGWEYDADRQGILFTEGIPGAYDSVDIRYRALVEFEVEEDPDK